MRLSVRLSVLLLAIVFGSSVAVTASEPLTLRMGFPYGGEIDQMQVLIDAFNQAHDHIQVELQQIGFDQFTTQYLGGVAPDIQYIWPTKDWAAQDMIVPLDRFLERDWLAEEWRNDFIPALYNFHTYQGRLYAAPFQLWTQGAYINVRHYQEAGVALPPVDWTWDEHYDHARKLVRRGPGGTTERWATGLYIDGWFFFALINSVSGQVFNVEAPEQLLESNEAKEALHWSRRHIEEDLAVIGSNEKMWMDQKLTWHLRGSFALKRFKQEMVDPITVVHYPRHTYANNAIGGEGIAMVATGKESRYDAVWEVIRWLTEPAQILEWVRVQGAVPSRRSVAESPEFIELAQEEPARITFFEGALQVKQPYPDWLAAEQFLGRIATWFRQALEGEVSDIEALTNMTKEARALYADIDQPLR